MTDDEFHEAFDDLRARFTHRTKQDFLDELEALFENHPKIKGLACKRGRTERYMAVSFDRRPNDTHFSYGYFDIFLRVLAFLASGQYRIRKPVNQVRVLRWNGSDADLVTVLKSMAPKFPQLNYRGLIVVPTKWPPAGHRMDLS